MRRFLHDLTILAAVSAAGGFALTRAVSPVPSESALVLRPVFVGEARSPVNEAMEVLMDAPRFAGASVGDGDIVPTAVVAWLTILYDPAAESHFLRLVRSATPAGRVYALAGLRATNIPLFLEAARPFRRSRTPVNTFFGCIGSITPAARIVADLDHGTWIGEFVSASRSRYFGDLPWPW